MLFTSVQSPGHTQDDWELGVRFPVEALIFILSTVSSSINNRSGPPTIISSFFFVVKGPPRSRCYGRTAALRLIVMKMIVFSFSM